MAQGSAELDRLFDLLPPPSTPPEAPRWDSVEQELGHPLPDDYKALVEAYGSGIFNDQLILWGPQTLLVEGRESVDGFLSFLRDEADDLDDELCRLPDGQLVPLDLGDPDSPPPYLGWGLDPDGSYGFWHRVGDDPNQWPVLFGELMYWDYHPDGLAAYLLGVLTGDIVSSCFEAPEEPPTFEPYDDENEPYDDESAP